MLHNLRVPTGIQGRAGHNLLEQVGVDATGTRESDQDAAFAQQFEGQQVDILITARSLFSLRRCGSELGRVEDDHVERARLVAKLTQQLKYVAFEPLGLLFRQVVQRDVFASQRQRVRR